MSEKAPNIADLSPSDFAAEEFAFSLDIARNAVELREGFSAGRPDWRTSDVNKLQAVRMADAVVGNLWRLGLEMDNMDDDRIAGVVLGAERIKDADNFGPKRYHPTKRPETPFWANYQRLLSGLDMSSPDRLQLVSQEVLIQKPMLYKVAEAAIAFTSGDEFTTPHRYGRKAERSITDPTSKYWGTSVHTDTFPGSKVGSIYQQGPNISIGMPTGRFTAESVQALKGGHNPKNPVWTDTLAGGFVEPWITVQNIHLGVQHAHESNVDTPSGFVEKFLDYAEKA